MPTPLRVAGPEEGNETRPARKRMHPATLLAIGAGIGVVGCLITRRMMVNQMISLQNANAANLTAQEQFMRMLQMGNNG